MSSTQKSIQKRITALRKTIQYEWHEQWCKFIIDNPDKPWDWESLSCNKFTKEKEQFIKTN